MANQNPQTEPDKTGPTEPTEPHGTDPEPQTDWKVEARKWEQRAKENKAAAEKLASLEHDKKTDAEKLEALEKRLEAKEKAEARAALVARVAKEKGVPADLIAGDSEEEMAAWADNLKAAITPKPAPKVYKPGSFDRGTGKDDDPMRDVVKKLFGNQ